MLEKPQLVGVGGQRLWELHRCGHSLHLGLPEEGTKNTPGLWRGQKLTPGAVQLLETSLSFHILQGHSSGDVASV